MRGEGEKVLRGCERPGAEKWYHMCCMPEEVRDEKRRGSEADECILSSKQGAGVVYEVSEIWLSLRGTRLT